MTWGSSCPQCGLDDCRWGNGSDCDGLRRLRRKWSKTCPMCKGTGFIYSDYFECNMPCPGCR